LDDLKDLPPRQRQCLAAHAVGRIPTVMYLSDYVRADDARRIWNRIYEVETARWVQLRGRRLQCWGGEPNSEAFQREALPGFLDKLCQGLLEAGIFPAETPPNHVLINEYTCGQGILPHTDGSFYAPRTATLSLGGDAVMTFQPRLRPEDIGGEIGQGKGAPEMEVLLRERSVVVFTDQAYLDYMHGIAETTSDLVGQQAPCVNTSHAGAMSGDLVQRPPVRISLTFRHLPVPSRHHQDAAPLKGGGDRGEEENPT